MNCLALILQIVAAGVTAWVVVYMICQSLMWVASKNIGKFLKRRNTTACQYMETSRFWRKGISKKYDWMVAGAGMRQLALALLKEARREIRNDIFMSNQTMQTQCPDCIFQYDCEQKYYPRCNACLMYEKCDKWKKNMNMGICTNFLCHRHIEKD